MRYEKGEEKEEKVGSEEYLRKLREKAVVGVTAFSQYSTTTPATKWRQVSW